MIHTALHHSYVRCSLNQIEGNDRQLGFSKDAVAIQKYWSADYPSHAMSEFEEDVDKVVEAVYGSGELPQKLRYDDLGNQEKTAYRYAFERDEELPAQPFDPRAIVGAASMASRNLASQTGLTETYKRVASFIAESRPPGQLEARVERVAEAPALRTQEIFDLLLAALGTEDVS